MEEMKSLLVVYFLIFGAQAAEDPWWQKPAYQKKIREQREVIVVIKGEKAPANKTLYHMTGAGVVRAQRAFVLQRILAFSELEKISPYFKKVVHQPEYNRVYFLLEAYGYEARLLIKYSIEDLPEKTVFHWNVVWGGFQGMIGSIELTSLKSERTEALLKSRFDDKEIPIPKFFTSFVLEVVVQQVAKSLRGHIEEKYTQSKGKL